MTHYSVSLAQRGSSVCIITYSAVSWFFTVSFIIFVTLQEEEESKIPYLF